MLPGSAAFAHAAFPRPRAALRLLRVGAYAVNAAALSCLPLLLPAASASASTPLCASCVTIITHICLSIFALLTMLLLSFWANENQRDGMRLRAKRCAPAALKPCALSVPLCRQARHASAGACCDMRLADALPTTTIIAPVALFCAHSTASDILAGVLLPLFHATRCCHSTCRIFLVGESGGTRAICRAALPCCLPLPRTYNRRAVLRLASSTDGFFSGNTDITSEPGGQRDVCWFQASGRMLALATRDSGRRTGIREPWRGSGWRFLPLRGCVHYPATFSCGGR